MPLRTPRPLRPKRAPARWCTSDASTWSEFAVVLEPEEPLQTARRAFYAGMVALRDALLAHAPPERPITFAWPDAIHVDGGLIGGGRLAWPADAAETEPPDGWCSAPASARSRWARTDAGLRPLAAALDEEGFDDLGSGRLVESFARHLMVAIDAWQANEFATVTRTYLHHLTTREGRDAGARPQRRSAGAVARPEGTRPARARRRTRCALVARSRQREGRAREAAAHHPARSVRHVRVRKGRRARRMGGPGCVRVRAVGCGRRSQARRARHFARASSASTRSAGRRWCRSSRRARSDRVAAVELLAQRLVEHFGAPDLATARPAAEEEIAFAASLSEHPKGMLAAVSRKYEDGAIREAFRTLTPEHRAEAAARLRVPGGRRRGRAAGGARRPAGALARESARERARAISGCPAAIICSIATRAAGCSSPMNS